ncbi:NADP-binding protein [Dacryopinax primogenitus]|uniref:NADP-binding protein n=1 Tax=Dacryopinax primogenitus (strain DJM 731) TaxID=1858805 RepID=M5GGQ1_DACPD|nr:NADP-binding protein [Dacryopinax primogenitus]EJU05878.1 NADP-binding protein [Dacryopinax primogenitus]
MSSTTPTVWLVSGANRGIGLGLVTELAARPDTIVFAGARSPSSVDALQALVTEHPGKVHISELISGDVDGNRAAVKEVERIAGRLDVVIANAGICDFMGPAMETSPEVMKEHFEVNVVGTLVLFQCTYALISRSSPQPKFIPVSSGAGSLKDGTRFFLPVMAYGASKAAENYLARRLWFEYPNLICFPISPEAVKTDLPTKALIANPRVADDPRLAALPLQSVETVASDILRRVDEAVRGGEEGPGFVKSDDGSVRAW